MTMTKGIAAARKLWLGAAVSLAVLSRLSPTAARADETGMCMGAALSARDDALATGASIDYGDSLQEVALYRLLTGIDVKLLGREFQQLTSGGPDGYELIDEEAALKPKALFKDLLIPAADLQDDPVAYVLYYGAQDMLKQEGLRSYRPERGGPENVADWWLRETADPIYRRDDFVGWLQAMAASDTFHRMYRSAGRGWYRPLISSWTYFDPKQWDVANYDRVTSMALGKWRDEGRLIWAAVAFSRLRADQAEADGMIDWFYQLHQRVKACAAAKDEAILYPLLRFHTLRVLFTRAAYTDDQAFYEKAMALLADSVPAPAPAADLALANGAIGTISDSSAARRAALLMAGYSDRPQSFYPTTPEILEGRAPQAQAWRDLRWASARTFDDYIKLAEGQETNSIEVAVLDGLPTAALYRLLEGNAFTPDVRDKIAESGWLRSYLLDQPDLNHRFLAYIADHHDELKDAAKALLAVPRDELAKENLLFLLRHVDLSVQIDTGWNDRRLWCNGLGIDAYGATLADIMGPVLRMSELPLAERWFNINYWYEYGHWDLTPASPTFSGTAPSDRRPQWMGGLDRNDTDASDLYQELSRLGHLSLPRDLLIGQVLDWAKSERSSFEKLQAFFGMKGDQRVAEALHLAIVNTRNICRIGDPRRMSRAAWIVLHDNPLWQDWAEKTPYWYN